MMTKTNRFVTLPGACLVLAALGYFLRQDMRGASAGYPEFTSVRAETSTSGGSPSLGRRVIEAQRSDGSRVSGELPSDAEAPPRRFVLLTSERMRIQIDDRVHAKMTMFFSGPAPSMHRAPDPQCGFSRLQPEAKPIFLGAGETLFGLATVGIQTETQLDGQLLTRKDWKAVDLDCLTVRVNEIRRDTSGNETGNFRIDVVKVTLGPPDPKLFAVPQDYTEQSPSEMEAAYNRQFRPGKTSMSDSTRKRLQRDDERYFANRREHGVQ